MYNYGEIISCAKEAGCDVLENEPMLKHTTFKVGGPARLFINVKNRGELKKVVTGANKNKIPFYILGNGSNLLVPDEGIEGCIIRLTGDFCELRLLEDNKIECGSGATLAKLCMFALSNSLSGLEFAWGIPGSVGGAAFMNAGAYSGEMKNVMVSCEHMTRDGHIGRLNGDDLCLSYRNSAYNKNGYIITSITVQLQKDDDLLIRERMDDFMERRKNKQPLEYPSAGSVFKRPEGHFASALIEQSGLKGKSVGGAMISTKHSGFIINTGKATCSDVLNLIELVKNIVKEKTGVLLECEVRHL